MLRRLSSLDSLITFIVALIPFSFFLPLVSKGCESFHFMDMVSDLYSKNFGQGIAIMSFVLPISILILIAYQTGLFTRPRWIYTLTMIMIGYIFMIILFLILISVKFKISRIIRKLDHIEFGGYILVVGFILLSILGTIMIFKKFRQKRAFDNLSEAANLAPLSSPPYKFNRTIFFRTVLSMLLILTIISIYNEFTPEGRARRYYSQLFETELELIEKEYEILQAHRKELQNSPESEIANLEIQYRERRDSLIEAEVHTLEDLKSQLRELLREHEKNAETSKAINKAINCVRIAQQKEHQKRIQQMSEIMHYRLNELFQFLPK